VLVAGKFWNNATQGNAAWIIFGIATWYFHWFRMARQDFDSKLRQVYFYLPAISGGAYRRTGLGNHFIVPCLCLDFRGTGTLGSQYFQFLGWAVPTILVGLGIWGYHQRLASGRSRPPCRKNVSPAQRVYLYLMAFLGLVTAVVGLSILFGLLVRNRHTRDRNCRLVAVSVSNRACNVTRGHAHLAVLLERYF